MSVQNFTIGERVKDSSTGRVGTIVKILANNIIPGLQQAHVQFDDSTELLYFTRFQKVTQPEEPTLDETLTQLEEEEQAVVEPLVALAEKLDEDEAKAAEARLEDNGAPVAPPKRPRGRPRKVVPPKESE